MKECEKLEAYNVESRKARLEKRNRMIQKKFKTPEASLLASSPLSCELSLNSLSLKTESEDFCDSSLSNFSSRSKKPSDIFYECLNCKFSEKDEKILRMMALRREAKIKQDEFASNARKIWEQEKEYNLKRNEEKKRTLKRNLAKKKRIEELEVLIRKNDREENLRKEKTMLELKINEKYEKVEKKQKDIQLLKKTKPEVFFTNSQILFHREVKRQMEEEKEAEKRLHLKLFEEKEKKSQEKLQLLQIERNKKLKEERTLIIFEKSTKDNFLLLDNIKSQAVEQVAAVLNENNGFIMNKWKIVERKHKCVRRMLKWQAAKNNRDELNKEYEKEQLRNLRFSEGSQAIKEERRRWTKQWKTKIIFEKNQRERHQHALIYNKLKEEEMKKVNEMKKIIQAKDMKMRNLKEKRESEILRSRSNARITAFLRQKIRATYQL